MKVRTIHAHQSRQQHTFHGIGIVRHMVAVHKDALLRRVTMQIDVHKQIAVERR